jgi:hypothetical protein
MANEYQITGIFRETLVIGDASVKVVGLFRESALSATSNVKVTGLYRETALSTISNIKVFTGRPLFLRHPVSASLAFTERCCLP